LEPPRELHKRHAIERSEFHHLYQVNATLPDFDGRDVGLGPVAQTLANLSLRQTRFQTHVL
jgi:hypothetical protein